MFRVLNDRRYPMKPNHTISGGLLCTLLSTGCAHTMSEHQSMLEQIAGLEAQNAELEARDEALVAELEKRLAELEEAKREAEMRAEIMKKLLEDFGELIEAGKLDVKIVDGKMMLELPGDVLFPSNSTDLGDAGEDVLEEVARVLAAIDDIRFQVEGHTDSDPIVTGLYDDNWELSCERALVVVRFLKKQGMAPELLSAAGYSMYDPVDSNETEQGKSSNRRIEIIVVPDLASLPDPDTIEEVL